MDYKEMYLTMIRASEEAIRILIDAQQKCEEMYLTCSDEEEIPCDALTDAQSNAKNCRRGG